MKFKESDLTPWFPPSAMPEKRGVYICKPVRPLKVDAFFYWNGKEWSSGRFSPRDAAAARGFKTPLQQRTWRGLTEAAYQRLIEETGQ